MKKIRAIHFALLVSVLNACSPSTVQRTDSLRSFIRENLFSTEHLAFGADPRAVSAVRQRTTKEDIPALVALLSDPAPAIVRVSQQVVVSYGDIALPYLEDALARSPDKAPVLREAIAMIQKRKSL